jgi:PPOX class probable F420-dependent enzyme
MPQLSRTEVEQFLSEREHLLRLATVDADGMPRIAPVWCTHRPKGDGSSFGSILFTPRERSAFLANLRRDPRIALSIDEDALPYRKLSVQGRAEIVHDVGNDDEWRDTYREIAGRYLDADAADRYLAATHDQPRALVAVDLDEAVLTTWRMPVGDEPATGIWAAQYYAAGSRMHQRLS